MMINRIGEYLNGRTSGGDAVAATLTERPDEPEGELLPWIDQLVRTKPGLALAGALAAGMVLAWFIKRR